MLAYVISSPIIIDIRKISLFLYDRPPVVLQLSLSRQLLLSLFTLFLYNCPSIILQLSLSGHLLFSLFALLLYDCPSIVLQLSLFLHLLLCLLGLLPLLFLRVVRIIRSLFIVLPLFLTATIIVFVLHYFSPELLDIQVNIPLKGCHSVILAVLELEDDSVCISCHELDGGRIAATSDQLLLHHQQVQNVRKVVVKVFFPHVMRHYELEQVVSHHSRELLRTHTAIVARREVGALSGRRDVVDVAQA